MRKLLWPILLLWTLLIGASLLWSVHTVRSDAESSLLETARNLFNHIVLARR